MTISQPRIPASAALPTAPSHSGASGFAVGLIFAMWTFLFYDPHYFVKSFIGMGPVILRIPLVLMLPTLLVLIQRGDPRSLYWPFALLVGLHLLAVPFAWNRGLALDGFKQMFYFFVVFATSIGILTTPSRALTLFKLFLVSFVWFCIQGLPKGLVSWHLSLANPDAYGPLGVIAIGLGYYAGLGAESKRWRNIGYVTAALGLVAVVASFARGAFLGAAVVLGLIFLRSPRKGATLGYGVLGVIVMLGAAEILFPGGEFWAEMATILEGSETGTGRDRWVLWKDVGWRVFLERPFLGVGAHNVGVVASQIIPPGFLEGKYSNPGTLYNRPLHNVYIQILSEQGMIGMGVWLAMVVDFFRRLRRLRTPAARAYWRENGGGEIDLLHISLGLESAMYAFLIGGVFYNQLYEHMFYSMLLQVVVLSEITARARPADPQPASASGSLARAPLARRIPVGT